MCVGNAGISQRSVVATTIGAAMGRAGRAVVGRVAGVAFGARLAAFGAAQRVCGETLTVVETVIASRPVVTLARGTAERSTSLAVVGFGAEIAFAAGLTSGWAANGSGGVAVTGIGADVTGRSVLAGLVRSAQGSRRAAVDEADTDVAFAAILTASGAADRGLWGAVAGAAAGIALSPVVTAEIGAADGRRGTALFGVDAQIALTAVLTAGRAAVGGARSAVVGAVAGIALAAVMATEVGRAHAFARAVVFIDAAIPFPAILAPFGSADR